MLKTIVVPSKVILVTLLFVALGGRADAAQIQDRIPTVAPAAFTASVANGTARFSWQAVPGAVGYRLFEVVADAPFQLALVADTSESRWNLPEDPERAHRYQIAAYSSDGLGPLSNVVTVGRDAASAVEAAGVPPPIEPDGILTEPTDAERGTEMSPVAAVSAAGRPTAPSSAPTVVGGLRTSIRVAERVNAAPGTPSSGAAAPVGVSAPTNTRRVETSASPAAAVAATTPVAAAATTPVAAVAATAPVAAAAAPTPTVNASSVTVSKIAANQAAAEAPEASMPVAVEVVAAVAADPPPPVVAEAGSVMRTETLASAENVIAAVPASAPALTATPKSASVTLTWNAVATATSYAIFRSTTTVFGVTALATTSATTYTNTGLTNGTTYFYTVRARNGSGDGPAATTVEAKPIAAPSTPAAPATVSGDRRVGLTWAAVSNATSYAVYRSTVSNAQTLLVTGLTQPTYQDTSLTNGVIYYYKITALNYGGESSRSAEVRGEPTAPPPPVDPDTLAAFRLLRQATWGPRPADVAAVKASGAAAFVDAQLALPASVYPDSLLTQSVDLTQSHFVTLALQGPDQLRQRVAWALHKIWVVSAVEINNAKAIVPYQRTLMQYAFGNYRDLMGQMTVSPAMGRYLNMLNNKSEQITGRPANENYARELMQLFTLGIPSLDGRQLALGIPSLDGEVSVQADGAEVAYTESDVKELARILTGWTFGDGNPATIPTAAGAENYLVPMEPVASFHDTGAKVFLDEPFAAGQPARADLEHALDVIFAHPNLPIFVSRQLIQQLVTSNPTPGYVRAIANVFKDNGSGVRGDLGAVVRAILLHPQARLGSYDPGKLGEPMLYLTSLLRMLNVGVNNVTRVVDGAAEMGQRAFFPPSVFSYYSPSFVVRKATGMAGGTLAGPEFQTLNTVTALARANFVGSLVAGSFGSDMTLDFTAYLSRAANAGALVDYCNATLMGTRMSPQVREEIAAAVRVTTPTNLLERVRTAIYLTIVAAQQQVD